MLPHLDAEIKAAAKAIKAKEDKPTREELIAESVKNDMHLSKEELASGVVKIPQKPELAIKAAQQIVKDPQYLSLEEAVNRAQETTSAVVDVMVAKYGEGFFGKLSKEDRATLDGCNAMEKKLADMTEVYVHKKAAQVGVPEHDMLTVVRALNYSHPAEQEFRNSPNLEEEKQAPVKSNPRSR